MFDVSLKNPEDTMSYNYPDASAKRLLPRAGMG